MKSMIFASLICLVSACAVPAVAAPALPDCKTGATPCTFTFENSTWLLTHGGRGSPFTANHMTPGFGQFCPQHTIYLETAKPNAGGAKYAMTPDQTFRGDSRFHVQCDRTAPPGAAQASDTPPAGVGGPAVMPPSARPQGMPSPRWNTNRVIPASDEEDL
jgi:hypothetical protein